MNPAVTLLLLAFLAATTGCNGPAQPMQNGAAWLKQHGYAEDQIDAVVHGRPLAHPLVSELRARGSADVRFLVARNATLTPEEIAFGMSDRDDYARSGAAWNPNLTRAQMETLALDPSHTVYCGLARNPVVPADILLRLRRERHLDLMWFALNPACPPELVAEIEASQDEWARKYLALTPRSPPGRNAAATAPPAP